MINFELNSTSVRLTCGLVVFVLCLTLNPGLAQIPQLDWPIEVVSTGHGFTEGPAVAKDGSVYFSDMDNHIIFKYDPQLDTTVVWQPDSRCTNGLLIKNQKMYACEAAGRAVVRYDLQKGPESREILVNRFQGKRLGNPNDLIVVGSNLYFTSFWLSGRMKRWNETRDIFDNRVYVLSLETFVIDTVEYDFASPNGIGYESTENKLFIGDIQADKLYCAELLKANPESLRCVIDLAAFDKKGPDGMAVHADGTVFLALYGSGELLVLAPDATPIGILPTGPKTSNCRFAADGQTLYVTAEHQLKRIIVPESLEF